MTPNINKLNSAHMKCNISDTFIHSFIFIEVHQSIKRSNRPVRYRFSHNTQYIFDNSQHSSLRPVNLHFNQAANATSLCWPGTGDTPLQHSAKQTTCNQTNTVSWVCNWNIWYRQLIDFLPSILIFNLQWKCKHHHIVLFIVVF